MKLIHASAASVGVRVAFQGLGFAITVVLARELGPEDFGAYTYALVVIMLLAVPCRAGLPQIVTRETATSLDAKQWPIQEGVWRWAIRLTVGLSLIVGMAVALSVTTLDQWIAPDSRILLLCALPLIPALTIAQIHGAALRGGGFVIRGQVPESLVRPASQLLLLAVLIAASVPGTLTPLKAMVIHLVAACLAALTGLFMLRRVRPYRAGSVLPQSQGRQWLAAALPVSLINSMHLINTQADTFLLGLFVGTEEVGVYRVAVQVSLLVAFGLHATKLIVQPRFATLNQEGAYSALQRLAVWFARINLALACSVLVLLVVLGPTSLPVLFGKGFETAYMPLVILALGHTFGALFGASGVLLVMAGFERKYAQYGILAATLNVLLNLALIPLFGMNGAAVATALTMPIPHVLGWWLARMRLHCNCSPFGTGSPARPRIASGNGRLDS